MTCMTASSEQHYKSTAEFDVVAQEAIVCCQNQRLDHAAHRQFYKSLIFGRML